MKRIAAYKKIFNVTGDILLSDLKVTYRSLMKEWHPDKFRESDEKLAEAEAQSKRFIEAYHFLVSIAPETHAANAAEYEQLITTVPIEDYDYKGETLKIIFQNGAVYEYYGVPKSIFNKMGGAATLPRFARRHIFHSYKYYRNVSKAAVEK